MSDQRFNLLQSWVEKLFPQDECHLKKLAGDASFRRYFRLQKNQDSFIVMDAPPDKENCRPFVAIAKTFIKQGIRVPEIIAENLELGFLLLSDLGDDLYANLLTAESADELYQNAMQVLPRIQACHEIASWPLPAFGEELLLREWRLFYDWAVLKHWEKQPDSHDTQLLNYTFNFLCQEFSLQPKVCVHRDYHSRNLLGLPDKQVGVLDFQDAVMGPVTYDALSLLRDCYVSWPRAQVEKWVTVNYLLTKENALLKNVSNEQYQRWFDLLGIQRHLKCLGIFARLKHLYNKPSYEKDIAPTLNYIVQVSADYPELKKFHHFMSQLASEKVT